MSTEHLKNTLILHCGERIDPPTIERICEEMAKTPRERDLEDLLRSACAIADRRGAGTAWDRFLASCLRFGINGITARTYRVLPDDKPESP